MRGHCLLSIIVNSAIVNSIIISTHSLPSLTGIYDSRRLLHIEAAVLHLQPLQLRTLVVALKA
jgi:hypothetical protein